MRLSCWQVLTAQWFGRIREAYFPPSLGDSGVLTAQWFGRIHELYIPSLARLETVLTAQWFGRIHEKPLMKKIKSLFGS